MGDTPGRATSDHLPEVSALQTCWPTADCISSRECDRMDNVKLQALQKLDDSLAAMLQNRRFRSQEIAEPSGRFHSVDS